MCPPTSVVGEEGWRLVTDAIGAAEMADGVSVHQTLLNVLTARHAGHLSVGTQMVVSTSRERKWDFNDQSQRERECLCESSESEAECPPPHHHQHHHHHRLQRQQQSEKDAHPLMTSVLCAVSSTMSKQNVHSTTTITTKTPSPLSPPPPLHRVLSFPRQC